MAPATKKFWDRFPEAYAETRKNQHHPEVGMKLLEQWLKTLPGRPVFCAYPAGFDFTFVMWYLVKYLGYSPFSFAALDIKTYGMALMNTEYRKSTKRNMPKRWFSKLPHTHVAIDDAIEQGYLFMNMLKERQKLNDIDN
jgi:DNA polymerase III alpha subunit (gram-positive type)